MLAARLRLQGASDADAALRGDRERWSNELRAAVLDVGPPIWLEKVVFETRPRHEPDTLLQPHDPVGALLRAARVAAQDPDRIAEVAASLEGLAARLPAEYRRLPEALDLADPEALAELLRGAGDDLAPQLLGIRERA